jgi:hypothetical protein
MSILCFVWYEIHPTAMGGLRLADSPYRLLEASGRMADRRRV